MRKYEIRYEERIDGTSKYSVIATVDTRAEGVERLLYLAAEYGPRCLLYPDGETLAVGVNTFFTIEESPSNE